MTHIRVIWRGTLPGGETWSISAAYIPVGVQVVPQSQAAMNAAATAIANAGLPAQLIGKLSTAVAFTDVRLEQRSAAGLLYAVGQGVRTAPQSGTGTPSKPFQTSMVLSLRTAHPGRRGRGRMYIPALAMPIAASSLRVQQADIDSTLAAMKGLLMATGTLLQAALGDIAHVLAVHSKVGALETEVNMLEMGDVLDVQRRRRDKAVENRTATPYG